MAETAFERYPCPASAQRIPTNNFNQKKRPGGGTYARPEGHGGSDIAPSKPGKVGEPIFPVRGGRVVWVANEGAAGKWGKDYGNRVLVKHEFALNGKSYVRYSFYAHLQTVLVKPGEQVTSQTKLGTLGNTGHSTAPHLHFEWHSEPEWKKGLIDPFPRLEAVRTPVKTPVG